MGKEYCVYWIHKDGHTDYNTQGYMGVTSNMKARVKDHSKMKGSCRHLYNAMVLYKDQISLKVLATGLDEEAVCLVEEMLRPSAKIGWNIQMGGMKGRSGLNYRHSDTTRRKIGLANTGRVYPQLSGKNNPNFKSANTYKGISILDKSEIILTGKQEIFEAGFTPKYIYSFVNGKFPRAHYKKYTWEIMQ